MTENKPNNQPQSRPGSFEPLRKDFRDGSKIKPVPEHGQRPNPFGPKPK